MKLFDWLANAKSVNDEVNADALRIASLEAANADLKAQTRAANIKAMVWQTKAEDLQDKLDAACERVFAQDAEMQRAAPLVAYAKSRKDSLARYELRRAAK